MKYEFDDSNSISQEAEQFSGRGIPSNIRAGILLALSVAVFLFSVVMCLYLIRDSGKVDPIATEAAEVKPLEYEVNQAPTQPVTQVEDDPYQLELKEPVSIHDSPVLNILLLGVDGDRNDTQMLCSINLSERSLALLSIPRDTYVAGDYEVPKAMNIYSAYEPERRVTAVKDAIRGMIGFGVDYYFVLNEAVLTEAVNILGGLPFEVPETPDYHGIETGTHSFNGEMAFRLFRYEDTWTEVETDSTRVQRTFLLTLLENLLSDKNRISEISVKLSQVADTDLAVEELAYLGYLLADFDFANAFSRALPGEEKKINKSNFYEINPEKAVEMLNEYCNPLQKELTVYTVNFRQQQGASGEGEYSDYGFSSSTTVTQGNADSSGNTKPNGAQDSTTGATESIATEGTPTEAEPQPSEDNTQAPEPPAETEDSGNETP